MIIDNKIKSNTSHGSVNVAEYISTNCNTKQAQLLKYPFPEKLSTKSNFIRSLLFSSSLLIFGAVVMIFLPYFFKNVLSIFKLGDEYYLTVSTTLFVLFGLGMICFGGNSSNRRNKTGASDCNPWPIYIRLRYIASKNMVFDPLTGIAIFLDSDDSIHLLLEYIMKQIDK